MSREADILQLLGEYQRRLESGQKEAEVDEMLSAIEALVPHANFSDLMFWCERERTFEELAQEADLRETLWEQGDWPALLSHIEAQMAEALAHDGLSQLNRDCAENTLAYFRRRAGERGTRTVH